MLTVFCLDTLLFALHSPELVTLPQHFQIFFFCIKNVDWYGVIVYRMPCWYGFVMSKRMPRSCAVHCNDDYPHLVCHSGAWHGVPAPALEPTGETAKWHFIFFFWNKFLRWRPLLCAHSHNCFGRSALRIADQSLKCKKFECIEEALPH